MSRIVTVLWDCKCPQTFGKVPPVETRLDSINKGYDKETDEWIIYLGYSERCSNCKKILGDGYGEPYFFPTKTKALKFAETLKKGEWKQ